MRVLLYKTSLTSANTDPPSKPHIFCHFTPFIAEKVSKLTYLSADTFCELDHIHISLLKNCLFILLPTLTKIINLSLYSDIFSGQFKTLQLFLSS